MTPHRYWWPNFLKADNLRNVADQIAVIAILAVGMTFVVITGGIDLSVGSLIALSAVTATLLIRDAAGSESATAGGMVLCCLAAIALCGLVGLFSGAMVTFFQVPPFIVTLAMMLAASGLADTLSREHSIYEVPDVVRLARHRRGSVWHPQRGRADGRLVRGGACRHVAHDPGRYVYAVGGNMEAARLCGVPVAKVLFLVYVLSGALAGLGGVVLASRLKSGSPTYGADV